jgi:hypothetical protein
VRAVRSFFSNIENYKNLPSYQLTDEDILHIRKRTTGIAETNFSHNNLNFTYAPTNAAPHDTHARPHDTH